MTDSVGCGLLGLAMTGFTLWGLHTGSAELYLGRWGRWGPRIATTFDRAESPVGFWATTALHGGVAVVLLCMALARALR